MFILLETNLDRLRIVTFALLAVGIFAVTGLATRDKGFMLQAVAILQENGTECDPAVVSEALLLELVAALALNGRVARSVSFIEEEVAALAVNGRARLRRVALVLLEVGTFTVRERRRCNRVVLVLLAVLIFTTARRATTSVAFILVAVASFAVTGRATLAVALADAAVWNLVAKLLLPPLLMSALKLVAVGALATKRLTSFS
jgi:hypothetical protein